MLPPRTGGPALRDDRLAKKHEMPDDETMKNGGDAQPDDVEEPEEADLEEGPDADELDDEEAFVVLEVDDEETAEEEEAEEAEEDEAEEDEAVTTRAKRRPGEEEEDEDDDLLSPDDVEADLDRILKDRLVAAGEDGEEDEEEDEPEDRADPGDRLQPKRADEQLCPQCFLLVRDSAPVCPVGDDACPIFS